MSLSDKKIAYRRSLAMAAQGILHPVLSCVRLTRRCDMSCDYCSEIHVRSAPDLGYCEFRDAVDIIYQLGNRDLVFTGGEPLLREFLPDLVRHAASRDAYVSVATNGRRLDDIMLSSLSDVGLDYLCVSVDCLYDSGKPFGKTLTEGLKKTLEGISRSGYNFQTQISTVVTSRNLSQLPEIVSYFSSIGLPTKLMVMMRNTYNMAATDAICLMKDDPRIPEVVGRLGEIRAQGALLIDGDFTLDRVRRFFSGEFSYNCRGGAFDLGVNNDGRLVICPDGVISDRRIFSLKCLDDYREFIEDNKTHSSSCGGCLWSFKQRLDESIGGAG